MEIKIARTLGFNVFNDNLRKINFRNRKILLNTISPNSYGISKRDSLFRKALLSSDILVLDGVFFSLGYFLKTGKRIKRNQGPFVVDFFLKKANKENLKVFFMGSTNETLVKIKNNLNSEFKNIEVGYYSPPFKENFSKKENNEIIKAINKFKPNILFVGMTCPKQEKWSFVMKKKLDVNLICDVGAVFDWIAGNQKPISPIWWKLRLAWLKRTIDRPEILKRYPTIFLYFKDMILSLLNLNNIKLN